MDAKQQKTFIGIVLIMVLGAAACCGLTVAIGAFVGYREAQELASLGPPDAGSRRPDPIADPDSDADPDADPDEGIEGADAPDDQALRDRFANDLLTAFSDTGRKDLVYEPDVYELVTEAGGVISLENLFHEYAKLAPHDRPDFVESTARGLTPPEIPASWDKAAPELVATVRDRIFVELLAIRSSNPGRLLQRPLSDDLVEVVVFDAQDSMQYLKEEQLATWGKNADEVFLQGRKQLAARSKEPFTKVSDGVYESPWEDNHDVGRALLFETLRKLKVKGDPVIFLPQRDHLLVTGANDEEGLELVGELVSDRLELPRANSGRGWRLTKTGLVPFIPRAEQEVLTVLRNDAAAKDANEQKEALDDKFDLDGTDVFVGTTLFTDDDDGKQLTYCVWTKGPTSLMPKAEFMVFVDLDMPEPDRVVAAAPWDEAMKHVAARVKADDTYWPRRYKVTTFPDKKTLAAIGTHRFFRRNKE